MYKWNNYTYRYCGIHYDNCSGIYICMMYSTSDYNLPYIVQRIFPRTYPYKYLCKSTNNYCYRRCSVALYYNYIVNKSFTISIYSLGHSLSTLLRIAILSSSGISAGIISSLRLNFFTLKSYLCTIVLSL